MIPLKLQIKNFLSYGSPTQQIDFAPYHLICLSGKNGHGKSALLDALTWAVWGHARKTLGSTKADEGLLRLGQTNMMVSLDFLCNGQQYRVRREYTYDRGKGVAQLDFGVIDAGTDRLRPLTDKTIKATQAKIEETIGLDFESFINSVFLRQGNSNEFSKKSPKERKEILATILGLSKFELLRKRALEKIRDGGITSAHLTRLCEHLTADTASAGNIQEQLTELNQQYNLLIQQEQQHYTEHKKLMAERKWLLEQQQEHQRLLFSYEQLQQNIAQQWHTLRETSGLCRQVFKQQREQGQHELLSARKKELEKQINYQQELISKRLRLTQEIMQQAEKKQQRAQVIQREQLTIQQEQTAHCQQIEKERNEIITQERALEHAQTALKQEIDRILAEQKTLLPAISKLEQQKTQLALQEAQFERRKSFYHKFVAQGNALAQELKQIKHKQQLAHDEDNPSCSLCEQNLSASRRRFIQQKFVQQETFFEHQLARLKNVMSNLKTILTEQHQQLEKAQHALTQAQQAKVKSEDLGTALIRHQAVHDAQQQQLQTIQHKLAQLTKELQTAQQLLIAVTVTPEFALAQDREYQDLLAAQQRSETELTHYQYNQDQHDKLKQELAHLNTKEESQAALTHQISLQQQRKQEVRQLCNTIRQLRQTAITLKVKLDCFAPITAQLASGDKREQELTAQLQAVAQEKEQVAHKKGALEQETVRIEKQKATLAQEQEQLKQLTTDIEEYQALAQALSKDGIQGLLIEHVLPEIEQEANNLLSKLTNNQAHLMIESLRDLKSGGAKETLDIKISDAMGIRPYELFSGGEAFRIDFALRLAISKLLARRNGTSLQTLIIDEGFGSQDEEGLNHIMESLYMIQEDFAKIIIVSHLPSMKEQFPTHFYVSKGPRGSTVQVIEQG
jgi:exonuclease SbcC